MISSFTVVSTVYKIEPLKYTPSNLAILKIFLMSNPQKGELLEITLFGKKAEENQYLQLHSVVSVAGKLSTRSYTSKQTGELVSMINLMANEISVVANEVPREAPTPIAPNPVTKQTKADNFQTMDDIPF